MKPKKKTSVPNKKTSKRIAPNKPIVVIDKTVATTKEKTHNTIEDPIQIKEHKPPPLSARNHPSRLSCLEKLQECNLSPFSSPGGNSFSPRLRKTLSPCVKEDKEKKKLKAKPGQQHEKCPQKKKIQAEKMVKTKPKMTKQQCNFAFQALLLKKMNQKKITQLSHQSSTSAPKLKKLNLNIRIPKEKKDYSLNRYKEDRLRDLKKKITEKYRKQLPNLKCFELKFFCSIVLMQRLWRQRRIKKFISQFISPRSNPQCNITGDLQRQPNACRLDLTTTTEEQTSELIKKYHNLSSFSDKKKQMKEHEIGSTEINSTEKKVNLKQLQLSSELSPGNQRKMIDFVSCLRDIAFLKPLNSKKKAKMNVFNLQESFSQKCLMQSFYERIFKTSPSKMNNFEVFKSKQEEKHLERSIELINSLASPQKGELVVIDERFQTQLQSKDTVEANPPIVQTAQISVETDRIQQNQANSKEINTIKQLNSVADGVIFLLLNQFCQQFHGFTSRSILKKKKKASLPGLKISQNTIRQYLLGLSSFMMNHYDQEVVRRFNLINPLSFLKIHHEYDENDDYIQEEDDQMNLPIVPNTLFYEYQQVYEAEKFVIPESDKKFSNFLEGLIKIHNLLLANCFSEMLQKTRIESIVLPWDDKFDLNRNKNRKLGNKQMQKVLAKIVESICGTAFMRVGQFHRRLDDLTQEERLLKSILLEYKAEGTDWSPQYEYLEIRMDLTKYVQEMILEQLMSELSLFI